MMNEFSNIIREIQDVELGILKVFQEICTKHRLRYFAIAGTCAGAIHCRGFIPWSFLPWEDDIRLAMPDEDYKKFLEAAKAELPSPYSILQPETCREEPLVTRIQNDSAAIASKYAGYSRSGGCIDLCPISGLPSARWRQKWIFRLLKLFKRFNYRLRFGRREKLSWRGKLFLALFSGRPFYYFTLKQEKLLKKYPFDESTEVLFPWRRLLGEPNDTHYQSVFPHEIFQSAVEIPFEDTTISVPAEYDKYLDMEFGERGRRLFLERKVSEYWRAISYDRLSFMSASHITEKTVKKIQIAELDILKVFQEICKKHHLKYFAFGGTCIGAIRHHGFIPWDDDIDLAMPYEDYMRFIELSKEELHEPYSIIGTHNCQHMRGNYMKVQNSETAFIESLDEPYEDRYAGIFIDIFPIHGLPREKWKQRLLFGILKFLKRCDAVFRFEDEAGAGLRRKLLFMFFGKHPFYFFTAKQNEILKRYLLNGGREVVFPDRALPNEKNDTHYQSVFPYEDFETAVEVPFEDTTIAVPVGYHRYLTMDFGDYMELPPAEERIPLHQVSLLDLNKSYREYLGRLSKKC